MTSHCLEIHLVERKCITLRIIEQYVYSLGQPRVDNLNGTSWTAQERVGHLRIFLLTMSSTWFVLVFL